MIRQTKSALFSSSRLFDRSRMDNNPSRHQQQQQHPHGAPRSSSTNRQASAHAVSNAQPHPSPHGVPSPSPPRLPGEGSFAVKMPPSSSGASNLMGGMARGPAASAMRSFAPPMSSPSRQQQVRLPQQSNGLQQAPQRLTSHLHGNFNAAAGGPMATAPAPATSWNVPNPLGQSPQRTGVSAPHGVTARSPSRYAQPSANPNALQQQKQQQQQQARQQRMAAAQQQQQQAPVKKKVVLTQEAKQALARAIWSAIRSPVGQVDPALMQAALKTGLPKHAILNAARVAREREAIKRKERQQQQLQEQQRKQEASRPPTMHSQVQQQYLQQQRLQQQQQQQKLQQQKLQQQQQKLEQQKQEQLRREQAQRESEAKIRERSKWKRVQSGFFMVQKNRFVAVPFSVGGMVRASNVEPTLKPTLLARNAIRKHAALVQQKYRQQQQALLMKSALAAPPSPPKPILQPPAKAKPLPLLNPDKHKRIKMEPKKFSKALDRVSRKSRQALAEGFLKQYKEFNKAISSHHQDFSKFHRQRKADLARLAKAVRDTFDKEEKKREKDAVQAERARLAALRANDMTAYSQLLEETKNDRLRFLLDKTEKHFTQISSLLQQRVGDDTSAAAAANGQQQPKSYYATAHSKTEEVRQPSILVGGDLKEYQMTGLQWMVSLYNNKLNGILADEMGLGKTIQAIALLSYLMEFKQNLGPYLVIVPLSTLSNWENEFTKWCPAARVIAYKGTPPVRREIYKSNVRTGHFNVLLTTYEYIIRDKKYLKNIEWQYAIVDEGHRMKNAQSKFAVTLSSQYTTKYRILLTGTPLMNDLSELWSLLNFLLPSIFNSVETFDQWFSRPFAQFGASSTQEEGSDTLLNNEERVLIIHRLHELLRPFMLRRVKSEVLDQLPEKVEKVLRCHLSSWQKVLYKQISAKAFADSSITGAGVQSRGLNNVVMQLRKVCNHPFLFSPEGYHIGEKLIRSSGKIALLDQMLPKLKAAGHRVLMFTQMTAVMTILEDYFAYRGYLSLRLDGSTPAEVREKRMYKFNAPDSPYFIFLLSTRAGGLGLNLTSADTVIIFDSDWNPMMDLQAQDRAHRIGQRSDVSVFRLITYSPVEEKILSRASEKLSMSELVVESGKFNKDSVDSDNSMERKRMMEVLLTDFDTTARGVPSEKSGSDDGDEDDDGSDGSDKEDLNELLSNNEADYQLYTEIDQEREKEGIIVAMYTEEEEVPDWIRYPNAAGPTGSFAAPDLSDGSRKRKEVAYDDGLTEKQFLRLMEKQATEEENARKKQKTVRGAIPTASAAPSSPDADLGGIVGESSLLTDWTFRKLISCSKSVVALKDPSTKRRLSDVFLEKPDPAAFPDYYEIIEKPIAINDILRKCRAKMYNNIPEFRADWKLMFANAVKFNGEDSWVVEDAKALEKELERVLKKNGFTDDQKPPTSKKKKKLRIKLSLKDLKTKTGD